MIVIHNNFLSAMHGFRDNDVLLQPDMTSSSVLRQAALHAIFHDGFWKSDHDVIVILPPGAFQAIFHDGFCKSDHDFQIAFHSNILSVMHGLRDNEVLLPTGYDVIVSPPPRALYAIFHVWFWKSDRDFLIAFYSNFLVTMHGFRDNEVLLQTGF